MAISDHTSIAKKNVRTPFLPAWYLPNGTKIADESELDGASESCERWSFWCGALVVVCIISELAIAIVEPPYGLFLKLSVVPDVGVAIGIVGEVLFGMWNNRIQTELRTRSNARLSEAIERAAKSDLARAKLEIRLQPRSLNREQWDLIHGLRGKFASINIGYETDAETQWFAQQLQGAFMSAGISVGTVARAIDVHSFGNMIFEPRGFDGANARTVGPLIEIFKGDIWSAGYRD